VEPLPVTKLVMKVRTRVLQLAALILAALILAELIKVFDRTPDLA